MKKQLEQFRQRLIANRAYCPDDPVDISIQPRIISKEKQQDTERTCRILMETSLNVLSDYLTGNEKIPNIPLNHLLLSLPLNQQTISGNARFDFLEESEKLKLIEMNFVNVGSSAYSAEACKSLFEINPSLKNSFSYKRPVEGIKRRMSENAVKNLVLLTKDDDGVVSMNDRVLIKESLSPIKTSIIPERDYNQLDFFGNLILYNGEKVDGIYPRHMDGLESLLKNEEFCVKLLKSNAFVFDHFVTMLLEDKDLRYLTKKNPETEEFVARVFDASQIDPRDYSNYVLKSRSLHSGKGVVISPTKIEGEDIILQEKIRADRFLVETIEGKQGEAVCDFSVYLSYSYNLKEKNLSSFEISGYLTRFSTESEIVNMCQGGGMIPTLIEK